MGNSIAPGSSADVNVKVTALTTNPNVPVQYKTVILKKNLVNGVNTLTQEMMSATNTKYVIKYDYMLSENITVPANCILEFDGGSLNNGTIVGQNTKISAEPVKVFSNNLNLAGSFNTLKLEWFGIIGANNANAQVLKDLESRINVLQIQNFEFVSDITFTEKDIILPQYFQLDGNGNKMIFTGNTGNACIIASTRNTLSNITFIVDSDYEGAVIENDTSKRKGHYWVCQLRLHNINIFGRYNNESNYKATAIRYKATNNHEWGYDGKNYITTNFSDNLIIQWVKNGIEIVLDNVDVQGGAYAWMNDFYFGYTFIQCSGTAILVDNRNSSTQNPPDSSGMVCFGDLYIQPCLAGNNRLIMLYQAEVDIKNLWPWDVTCIGELRNTTSLTLGYLGRGFTNQGSVTEGGETYSFLAGFKIYETSKIYHNEVFSNPIKWDNYNPVSGTDITRIKGSSKGIAFVQRLNALPFSLIRKGTYKTNMAIGDCALSDMLANLVVENGKVAFHSTEITGSALRRIVSQYVVPTWDGTCQCFCGDRNTREFNIRLSSSTYTSDACNKITYTPYIDSEKQTPLLSKLTFQAVRSIWSTDENIAKIVKVEVSGNDIIIYVETTTLTSSNTRVGFSLEFSDIVSYTKTPTVADIDTEITDTLLYMPKESDVTKELAYRTFASYVSKPATPPYRGFRYFAKDLKKPIFWTGDTSKGDNGWVDADGLPPTITRSGNDSQMPTNPDDIYEGFMFMINTVTGNHHFPIYAHINGNVIEWYKSDGTLFTGY